MGAGEAGKLSALFIDAGIEFHGAAAQGIEIGVNPHIPLGKSCKMAGEIDFGNFRQEEVRFDEDILAEAEKLERQRHSLARL